MAEKNTPKTKQTPKAGAEKKVAKTSAKKPEAKKKTTPKTTTKTATARKSPTRKTTRTKTSTNVKEPAKKAPEAEKKPEENKDFLKQASDVFEEKAKIAREKTKEFADEVADKSSSWTKDILGKIRKGFDSANAAVNKFAEKAGESVQEYTDRYKLQAEIRRIQNKQKEDFLNIGKIVYDMYPELGKTTRVYKDVGIAKCYKEISDLEKQLENLNEELKKMNEKETE